MVACLTAVTTAYDRNLWQRPELPKVLAAVEHEVRRAEAKFAKFVSAHEAWAVLYEEIDELWDEVRANRPDRARCEAVQVAAMSVRFIRDAPPARRDLDTTLSQLAEQCHGIERRLGRPLNSAHEGWAIISRHEERARNRIFEASLGTSDGYIAATHQVLFVGAATCLFLRDIPSSGLVTDVLDNPLALERK